MARRFRSFALSTRTKANCAPAPRRIALKCGRKVNALLAFEVFSCSFGNAGGTEGLNIVVISLRMARRFRSFALSTRTRANCAPAPRRIALKCERKVNALVAFEVFSCSFGNAGGTEGPNTVVISLRIARRFRSFALSTRTKANCAPAPRRIALNCGRKVDALLAFEVFSCSFGNAGWIEGPNIVVISLRMGEGALTGLRTMPSQNRVLFCKKNLHL